MRPEKKPLVPVACKVCGADDWQRGSTVTVRELIDALSKVPDHLEVEIGYYGRMRRAGIQHVVVDSEGVTLFNDVMTAREMDLVDEMCGTRVERRKNDVLWAKNASQT